MEKNERITIEEKRVKRTLPNFRMFERDGFVFFSGLVTTELNKYKLRLVLDRGYPFKAPKMFIVSPRVLYTADGRSISSLGCSHSFHTVSNGPGGCIQISYPMIWEPCCTCVKVIIGGIVWINAYEEHRRTGKSIEEILCRFK
jgi:ubiquitin-protein ligase